jgi:hypothetical protein
MESAEMRRVIEDAHRDKNWKRWGPYLSERQWGTVREDYSGNGDAWASFPHDHARSRAYRWGEDGLLGWTDRQSRLCFAVALWNGRDPILKERLFGLTNNQGNHGEDVKECYYYLEATPTASYAKALYKYPQAAFPYAKLVEENAKRGRDALEYELEDTGIFDENRYFDVFVEYIKAAPDDTYIQLTIANRGPEAARLDVLPTLWFRNTWSWGCRHEGCTLKPRLWKTHSRRVAAAHESLQDFEWLADRKPDAWLFTDNETNTERLYKQPNAAPWVKDAFHRYVVAGETDVVNPRHFGTKAAAHYRLEIPAGGETKLQFQLRLRGDDLGEFDPERFAKTLAKRRQDADDFYAELIPANVDAEQARVARQAYGGLVWTKQFYHYVIGDWIEGDPYEPPPPKGRENIRNGQWRHVFAKDVLSMPDKWEYPWFAAWDLAFHMVPFARLDPVFAKQQLTVLLREWYMHPNGQLPAYEWEFGDVNPPVHAWAAWRVYKIADARGFRDREFLESTFQKLLLNFTWWVNRKDQLGQNLFSGGFLGLDNIGVFDRSRPLPGGGHLHQADGTAWMGFYCVTMLAMALELAKENSVYQDMASKFFEHFIAIADALNHFDGTGLWNEEDGFYYDHLRMNGSRHVLKTRSMVGLIPMLAVELLDLEEVQKLTGFSRRMEWFIANRPDLARHMSWCDRSTNQKISLLALPSRERLERILVRLLDEGEFLSPHGIRSLSAAHAKAPFTFEVAGEKFTVPYTPGESTSGMFGGNSNWRGPVWFPINYLLIEALERYHRYYGDGFKVECPRGSGIFLHLGEVANFLSCRLTSLFTPDASGARPCHGGDPRYATDPHWKDLILFHEYFHGDTGRGLGATHQTGWTALVTRCIEDLAQADLVTRAAAKL